MCRICREEIDDARYEGDHEKLERILSRQTIDKSTREEIDDARYEGDHEKIERIYRNMHRPYDD